MRQVVNEISDEQMCKIVEMSYLTNIAEQPKYSFSTHQIKEQKIKEAIQSLGIPQLRKHQEICVNNILDQVNQIISIPTAGGKSLIYTIPSLVMQKITVIVTPTIVLRNDQVQNQKVVSYQLTAHGENSINLAQFKQLESGLVFVTPEKLSQQNIIDALRELTFKQKICLFAVDECHLMTDWSGFRKEFLIIPQIFKLCIDTLQKDDERPAVAALTATLSPDGIHELQKLFKDFNMKSVVFDCYRPNLSLTMIKKKMSNQEKQEEVKNLLQVQTAEQSISKMKLLKKQFDKTIIYCRSKQKNEDVAEFLNKQQIQCLCYHSSIRNQEEVVQKFVSNQQRVITATIAFGMGVNITDVTKIINFDLPGSINEFLQKIGRAGRSGAASSAFQFFSREDTLFLYKLIIFDRKETEQNKKIQIQNAIQIVQMLNRNVCYFAQMQRYFCGFNVQRCGKCSACNNSQSWVYNLNELVQVIYSFLRLQQTKITEFVPKFIQEMKEFSKCLTKKEVEKLMARFGDKFQEELAFYVVNEMILSGDITVDGNGDMKVQNEIEWGWLVI